MNEYCVPPCLVEERTHIHTHAHARTHARTHARAHTHTHIHTYTHTHIHAYTHTRIHAYTHTRIHAYTHTRIHAYTHTRIHAYTHTRIHAYTHTRIHAYTHTRIHAYTHTRIHAYTHTHARTHARTHASTHARTHARTHTPTHAHRHARARIVEASLDAIHSIASSQHGPCSLLSLNSSQWLLVSLHGSYCAKSSCSQNGPLLHYGTMLTTEIDSRHITIYSTVLSKYSIQSLHTTPYSIRQNQVGSSQVRPPSRYFTNSCRHQQTADNADRLT